METLIGITAFDFVGHVDVSEFALAVCEDRVVLSVRHVEVVEVDTGFAVGC